MSRLYWNVCVPCLGFPSDTEVAPGARSRTPAAPSRRFTTSGRERAPSFSTGALTRPPEQRSRHNPVAGVAEVYVVASPSSLRCGRRARLSPRSARRLGTSSLFRGWAACIAVTPGERGMRRAETGLGRVSSHRKRQSAVADSNSHFRRLSVGPRRSEPRIVVQFENCNRVKGYTRGFCCFALARILFGQAVGSLSFEATSTCTFDGARWPRFFCWSVAAAATTLLLQTRRRRVRPQVYRLRATVLQTQWKEATPRKGRPREGRKRARAARRVRAARSKRRTRARGARLEKEAR